MKKRLKLKKKVWIIIIIITVLTISFKIGFNKYKQYKYTLTYEYKLMQIGYTLDEANKLQKLFSNKMLDKFLNEKKNDYLIPFASEKYYLEKNLDKYIEYKIENKDLEYSCIVSIVNTHRDKDYYEEIFDTNTSLDELILVNKYYKLNSDFLPQNITNISTLYSWGEAGSKRTRQVTLDAFLNMYNDAIKDGIYLMINSGYRTYDEQESVYKKNENKYGDEYADTIAARPGHSEHQSGLALDIFSKTNSNTKTFEQSDAYSWLKDNSYKYGFILRYPKDKEEITGYSFESWHYRYVGKDVAKYIYENNITFDEYYAYYIEK